MKKLSEIFSEQHREKGRFKPTVPRNVSNVAGATPRASSDSADVSLKERCWTGYRQIGLKKKGDKVVPNCVQENAAAIAAATAIAKKKSGNYDKEGFRKTDYKNPDHPNVKSNEQRRKEMKEDVSGDTSQQVAGSAQSTLVDKPNREPMKTYKDLKKEEVKKSDIPAYLRKQQGQSPLKMSDLKRKDTISDKENLAKLRGEEVVEEGAVPAKEKTVMVRHKTSGKELVVTAQKAKELKQHDYHPVKEEVEQIDEKNVPTSPEKWAQAKAQAKAKFDVYPSAYANGWAAKKYKAMGGGWKSVSEAVKDKFDIGEYDQEGDMAKSDLRSIIANAQKMHDMLKDADNLPEWVQSKITKAEDYISTVANYMTAEMNEEWSKTGKEAKHTETGEKTYEYHEVDKEGKPTGKREYRNAQGKSMGESKEQLPFEPDPPKKKSVIAGKYGSGYSTARHLARMAMQKQSKEMKKMPVKEETRKAAIVKDIMKKKKTASEDAFQKDPELSNTLTKV